MKSTDVIISGGGVPGLSLGLILAKAGLDVVVCDPSPLVKPENLALSGRTIALMESSLAVLDKAGILEKVSNSAEDLKILSVVDGNFRADFASSEINMARFGQNIAVGQMQAYAAALLREEKNARLIQDKIEHFEVLDNAVHAHLSNGEIISAKLLIGADGRNSIVRKNSDIDIWEHDYEQMALTGVIEHSKNHGNASTEFHFSGGPFTFVPMKGNRCSFVWMEKTQDAQRIQQLSKLEIEAIMQERSQNIVGKISLVTKIDAFPIKIQAAKKLVGNRIALMAEAAHVISPIGAQGMNLSLRDVACLADVILSAARIGIDFGTKQILKKYQDERLVDISLRIAGTDALNRSVATDSGLLKKLKILGFKAASNIPPLRSLLVHEALAPTASLTQDILSALETRATVKTSTLAAPAA